VLAVVPVVVVIVGMLVVGTFVIGEATVTRARLAPVVGVLIARLLTVSIRIHTHSMLVGIARG
jgi:hypothetical protein